MNADNLSPLARTAYQVSTIQRVASLDGLRGLSILLVMLGHSFERLPYVAQLGHVGVSMFMVLSGFLITSLLVAERLKSGTVDLKQFYIRRTFRIFPASYSYILFILLLSTVGAISGITNSSVLHAVTYTVNYTDSIHWVFGHLWSLSLEEQFYLLWPLAFLLLPTRWLVPSTITFLGVFPVLRGNSILTKEGVSSVPFLFDTYADALLLGCLLSLTFQQLQNIRLLSRMSLETTFVSWVVALGSALYLHEHAPFFYAVVGYQFFVVTCALLLLKAVDTPTGFIYRALNWKPLATIGTLSYSLYLWQQPFLFPTDHPRFFTNFPINYLFVFVAAYLSYRFIETPCRKWGRGKSHGVPSSSSQTVANLQKSSILAK